MMQESKLNNFQQRQLKKAMSGNLDVTYGLHLSEAD